MVNGGPLDGYFDALTRFQDAVRVRDYPLAAQLLGLGLEELRVRALREFVSSWGVPPSIPFLQGPGIAVAALYPSTKTDALFAALAEDSILAGRFNAADALEAARIVRDLWTTIAASPGLDRKELRTRLQPVDGRLMGSLLDYLVKAGMVFDRAGTYSTQTPNPQPTQAAPRGFREGYAIDRPAPLDLLQHPEAVGVERLSESWKAATPALVAGQAEDPATSAVFDVDEPGTTWPLMSIPPSDRRTGKASTSVLSRTSWLLRYTRPTAALEHQYTAEIIDRQGHSLTRFDLPHPVRRVSAFPSRHHMTILDTAGDLYAYREDGELLANFNLAGTPEIQQRLADLIEEPSIDQQRPGTVISAIDYDPASGQLLFAIASSVWCARSDGSILWSHQLPPEPASPGSWTRESTPKKVSKAAAVLGLRPDPTPREIAAFLNLAGELEQEPATRQDHHIVTLRNAISFWNSEWITAAFFTETGSTICGGSGLNIDLDPAGVPIRIWTTKRAFLPLALTPAGLAGTVQGRLVTVANNAFAPSLEQTNPVAEHSTHAPGAVALGTSIAAIAEQTLTVTSIENETHKSYRLPRALTAIYPTVDGIVIEMGARRALLPSLQGPTPDTRGFSRKTYRGEPSLNEDSRATATDTSAAVIRSFISGRDVE